MKDLRSAVRGRVWLPGDPGFDQARRPWNRAVEQPAAAVVEVADAADAAALVRHARSAGLSIAAQANGHGATGRTDGVILLRTTRLDELRIDPEERRAHIGAGVASGRVQEAAAPHGLSGLPGSSPVVSVTGVALGGGLSWFGRRHGWVADSVIGFDIVDAEGWQRHVTDGDLFWALRGGGGDFAVVTAVELALHPVPGLYGGRVVWPGAHTPAVLDAFRRVTATAPDELTVWLDLVHFPGAEPMVAIDTTYLGDEGAARDLLAPFDRLPRPLADGRRKMAVSELGSITADPTEPSASLSRTELLTRLDDEVAEALLAEPIEPLLGVQLRHLGGAFARPSDSPHGPLTEPYALYFLGLPGPGVPERMRAFAESLPVSGRKPLTFLGPAETTADAFGPAALDRLRAIKRHHDPHGVFRGNFPVASS